MIQLRTLLAEITLGGVTPYATQFTWKPTMVGHRDTTFQADDITITLAMVNLGAQQWSFAILTPTQDGEGHTVAHDRSMAVGRINYLRLMSTALEALMDFATQWQPASIDITGSDTSSGAKEQQKSRISCLVSGEYVSHHHSRISRLGSTFGVMVSTQQHKHQQNSENKYRYNK